ncbi:MAG: alpha/beta hydrolase [Bryobacteraceae bacterium]|jgi:pimeloyl-ACP methyl ester carboxylesterase
MRICTQSGVSYFDFFFSSGATCFSAIALGLVKMLYSLFDPRYVSATLVAWCMRSAVNRRRIAGHDLGAMVAHNAAILRPDMFRAVILLSVPYGARTEGAVKPTEAMRRRAPTEQQFYQTYFQMPGAAEKEFDADPKRTLRMFLYSLSGSIPKEHKWRYMFGVNEKALDGCVDPEQLPAWLKPADLDYYANE